MIAASPIVEDAYALARRLYAVTAAFSDAERGLLGRQVREAGVDLATRATDAVTTDDPAERQEMLRQAGVACVRLRLLLRIARDMGELAPDALSELVRLLESVDDGIAHERRSVRR